MQGNWNFLSPSGTVSDGVLVCEDFKRTTKCQEHQLSIELKCIEAVSLPYL